MASPSCPKCKSTNVKEVSTFAGLTFYECLSCGFKFPGAKKSGMNYDKSPKPEKEEK